MTERKRRRLDMDGVNSPGNRSGRKISEYFKVSFHRDSSNYSFIFVNFISADFILVTVFRISVQVVCFRVITLKETTLTEIQRISLPSIQIV